MKGLIVISCFVILSGLSPQSSYCASRATVQDHEEFKWTIMVYANGRNNGLEDAVLCDFYEMLTANLNSGVRVIVEMSLDGMKTKADRVDANFCPEIPHYNTTIPYWRGTRRFQVVNHQATPRTKVRHGDLGKGAALEEFAKWALGSFPAEHYMLVLSSHGDGSPHFLNFLSRRKTTRQ
jgi:hypothetical protein